MAGCIATAHDPAAFVGGNLGTPYCRAALSVMEGGRAPKYAVLELSSYQLETIEHLPVKAAVVTNLTPDHLDRYASAEAYYQAKAQVLELVTADGGVAFNAADPQSRATLFPLWQRGRMSCHFDVSRDFESTETGGIAITPDRLLGRFGDLPVDVGLKNARIVGPHNRQNAAAAVAAAVLAGIPADAWQLGLDAYAGIAHRLERLGEIGGVPWFNDSKATNVDAAVTALRSFSGGVHLIAGGVGKGAPYAPLASAARGVVKAVYSIGADAPAIEAAFAGVCPVLPCATLEAACREAFQRSAPGETVLLSPACASFDQFRDYAHRGDTFRALFAALGGVSDGQKDRGGH
jgi:UDP-N-acetylmuramoylalanine--D-glutamate ligase